MRARFTKGLDEFQSLNLRDRIIGQVMATVIRHQPMIYKPKIVQRHAGFDASQMPRNINWRDQFEGEFFCAASGFEAARSCFAPNQSPSSRSQRKTKPKGFHGDRGGRALQNIRNLLGISCPCRQHLQLANFIVGPPSFGGLCFAHFPQLSVPIF
jgi:hypothetical protein